jgi:hypothetical protein
MRKGVNAEARGGKKISVPHARSAWGQNSGKRGMSAIQGNSGKNKREKAKG